MNKQKYWFTDKRPAIGVYQEVLEPPFCNADVTYWLNKLSIDRNNSDIAAINTAVEATTLNERTFKLRDQDIFLRDNIQENDILVVSIGGNDVAMAPTLCTALSILGLMCLPVWCLEKSCSKNPISVRTECNGVHDFNFAHLSTL